MFAFIAAIFFFLQLIHVRLGTLDLVVAGLLCIALHLMIGGWTPSIPWRRNP